MFFSVHSVYVCYMYIYGRPIVDSATILKFIDNDDNGDDDSQLPPTRLLVSTMTRFVTSHMYTSTL